MPAANSSITAKLSENIRWFGPYVFRTPVFTLFLSLGNSMKWLPLGKPNISIQGYPRLSLHAAWKHPMISHDLSHERTVLGLWKPSAHQTTKNRVGISFMLQLLQSNSEHGSLDLQNRGEPCTKKVAKNRDPTPTLCSPRSVEPQHQNLAINSQYLLGACEVLSSAVACCCHCYHSRYSFFHYHSHDCTITSAV